MKHLLLTLIFSFSTLLSAQSDTTSLNTTSPVFAQAGLGVFPHLEFFNLELSAAVGYRFSPHFGLGVEFRSTLTSNISFGRGGNLLGLHLRGQLNNGWMGSLGGGTVLFASRGSDGLDSYEYRSGGRYLAIDLGYQFRRGPTIGLYATTAQGQIFNHLLWDDATNTSEPTGESSADEFLSMGLKIGYTFPGRGKRRQKL